MACFLSHCGWNSAIEGVSNGLPFLCWPYFAEQFLNQSYICDALKLGGRLNRDENGIVGREEIKNKVELLLTDQGFKARAALDLKAKAMNNTAAESGRSGKNFNNFVKWVKDERNDSCSQEA